jgi:hypothetical protein
MSVRTPTQALKFYDTYQRSWIKSDMPGISLPKKYGSHEVIFRDDKQRYKNHIVHDANITINYVNRCLPFCPFSIGHCGICPSIYGFWLRLWYLQTLHTDVYKIQDFLLDENLFLSPRYEFYNYYLLISV